MTEPDAPDRSRVWCCDTGALDYRNIKLYRLVRILFEVAAEIQINND